MKNYLNLNHTNPNPNHKVFVVDGKMYPVCALHSDEIRGKTKYYLHQLENMISLSNALIWHKTPVVCRTGDWHGFRITKIFPNGRKKA